LIRREIYLYRTHAGPYTDLKGKDDEKRRILLENLKKASRVEKIYATDRMQENPTIKQTVQDVLLGAEATPPCAKSKRLKRSDSRSRRKPRSIATNVMMASGI
jgi:hypothetical protein